MDKEIELLNKKIEAQDKIINTQALEIARLKETIDNAKEILNGSAMFYCEEDRQWLEELFKRILEILGDKENE